MRKQRGATLIEVLVSVLLLAVGLLGMAATQMLSMRNANGAHQRYMATLAAHEIAERMRANPAGVSLGSYDGEVVGSEVAESEASCIGCTVSQLAEMDKREWGQLINANLPSGRGVISRKNDDVTVKVMWEEPHNGEGDGSADDGKKNETKFEMTVEL